MIKSQILQSVSSQPASFLSHHFSLSLLLIRYLNTLWHCHHVSTDTSSNASYFLFSFFIRLTGNFIGKGGAHADGTKSSGDKGSGLASYVASLIDTTLTWNDIAWLRFDMTRCMLLFHPLSLSLRTLSLVGAVLNFNVGL